MELVETYEKTGEKTKQVERDINRQLGEIKPKFDDSYQRKTEKLAVSVP